MSKSSKPPIFLEVALWYYCMGIDHPKVIENIAPAYFSTMQEMLERGLLVPSSERDMVYAPTEALHVYVKALCAVPTPVQRWVIPDED